MTLQLQESKKQGAGEPVSSKPRKPEEAPEPKEKLIAEKVGANAETPAGKLEEKPAAGVTVESPPNTVTEAKEKILDMHRPLTTKEKNFAERFSYQKKMAANGTLTKNEVIKKKKDYTEQLQKLPDVGKDFKKAMQTEIDSMRAGDPRQFAKISLQAATSITTKHLKFFKQFQVFNEKMKIVEAGVAPKIAEMEKNLQLLKKGGRDIKRSNANDKILSFSSLQSKSTDNIAAFLDAVKDKFNKAGKSEQEMSDIKESIKTIKAFIDPETKKPPSETDFKKAFEQLMKHHP